jgi:hypothetical protein
METQTMIPVKGTKYKHHNGNIYEVLLIANENSDRAEYPITVVYVGVNGNIWAKPLDNFLEKMSLVT